jgi:hypothetical protein
MSIVFFQLHDASSLNGREKSMKRSICMMCAVACLVLSGLFTPGGSKVIAGQGDTTAYPSMTSIDQYLMSDRNAEIAFARSAAPKSISQDAEVYVLGRHGYEVAAKGKNGFVCVLDRSWMQPFENPEFWNPSIRLPLCLNPQAARSHLPLTFKTTELAFNGLSKTQISDAIKAAFVKRELPLPEAGSMCYMMSKQQNFGPKYGNADPHLMFWFSQKDRMSWGAEFPDSPVDVHQYSPQPLTEFSISVSKWSDGTAAQ